MGTGKDMKKITNRGRPQGSQRVLDSQDIHNEENENTGWKSTEDFTFHSKHSKPIKIFKGKSRYGRSQRNFCCQRTEWKVQKAGLLQEFGCKKSCVNHAAHHIGGSVRDEI